MTEDDVVATVEQITVERLRIWVDEGWVLPRTRDQAHDYSAIDIARVRLIRQLEEELAVNREGIDVVLSLLDQVYGLRAQLRAMCGAIDAQSEEVRAAVRRALGPADPGDTALDDR